MNKNTDEAGTRQAVLDLVVEKGPVTATVIAQILRLTAAAVRRHITALEHQGAIEVLELPVSESRGRGRPARHYVATEVAHGKLPQEYSDLASRAIEYLGQVAGEDAIDAFAAARSREIERRYSQVVRDAGTDPQARAKALADALTADGYAATVRQVGNGFAIQLCQGHCPVQDVAHDFPQLCDAETQAFSRLLNVHVQRLATLAGGEHVCTTHVPIGMPAVRNGNLRSASRGNQLGRK
ncbi:transcriptional regulator [Boudabousia liubingyangii]|uniref:Transcriptional regulator n=1 Tax=Boudabousia liubingyangii TaxID=1921764 RepID=A0A1Q5PN76_9ACTO|nr:helix-turn-helix domain-containing protein [Boudabousia liubingyangii]OKL47580.1 transcriptional regulator [Boudabousia liubingyangii]OKL49004.1 transcriptional regulator [Boudabousia liubingyangii]